MNADALNPDPVTHLRECVEDYLRLPRRRFDLVRDAEDLTAEAGELVIAHSWVEVRLVAGRLTAAAAVLGGNDGRALDVLRWVRRGT